MFTVLYPIVRIDQPYSEVFRNFLYHDDNTLDRSMRLLVWQRVSDRRMILRNLSIENNAEMFTENLYERVDIFEKCHTKELCDEQTAASPSASPATTDRVWKVFTDHELVEQYLTDAHYQLVASPEQADILFVMKQLKDFREETIGEKLLNQFPFENIVTNKELLAIVARRWKSTDVHDVAFSTTAETDPYVASQGSPPWLATTFNLTYELPRFAVYFQVRCSHPASHGLSNLCRLDSIAKITISTTPGSSNRSIQRVPWTSP